MADAAALFKRHWTKFQNGGNCTSADSQAIIYAACILAEAIRTELDSVDFKVIEPQKEA